MKPYCLLCVFFCYLVWVLKCHSGVFPQERKIKCADQEVFKTGHGKVFNQNHFEYNKYFELGICHASRTKVEKQSEWGITSCIMFYLLITHTSRFWRILTLIETTCLDWLTHIRGWLLLYHTQWGRGCDSWWAVAREDI